jgi:hypothetical protein
MPLLAVSFVQGILLFWLYRAVDTDAWPSQSPLWSFPLWTLAVACPLLVLLSADRSNYVAVGKLVGAFGALLALLAVYTGWQAEPYDQFPISSLSFAFGLSITLACFKAAMYLQQRANGDTLTYPLLFTNSWRNFLIVALSLLFTLIFWLILVLWGQLFKVIGIDFFRELFKEDWFIIPSLTVAFGIGITLFRNLTRVIDNITKLLHWLTKLLLPLVIIVGVVFLSALPFVGLDILWATGSGTALLLWLLAITLFFTNAVYQDGREKDPYPRIIHQLIYIGLCALPIYSALSFYGLFLRLHQYGWTIERCWAFVVWLLLSLFAVGYVAGIVRRRSEWTSDLARVNTVMGLVVLAVMVLANSPILDFRKASLRSQLNRVQDEDMQLADIDFFYIKNHLARPGYLWMEDKKASLEGADAELLSLIEDPLPKRAAVSAQTSAESWSRVTYRPESFELPFAVETMIDASFAKHEQGDPIIVQVDLDSDGENEYLLLFTNSYGLGNSILYYRNDIIWRQSNVRSHAWSDGKNTINERLREGEIELVEPRFKDVKIGDLLFEAPSK